MAWEQKYHPGYYSTIVGMDSRASWLLGAASTDYLREPDEKEKNKVLFPIVIAFSDAGARRRSGLAEMIRAGAELYIRPRLRKPTKREGSLGEYLTAFATRTFINDLVLLQYKPKEFEEKYPEGWMKEAFRKFRDLKEKQITLCTLFSKKAMDGDAIQELLQASPGDRADAESKFLGGDDKSELAVTAGSGRGSDPGRGGDVHDDRAHADALVVIGIIDDGIAFAHERFRSGLQQSRIESFWHQDPADLDRGNKGLDRPYYGVEFKKDHINSLLALNGSIVDEDLVYSTAGTLDFADPEAHRSLGRRVAHGTHVLDLAAGAAWADDKAPPIIAVQLRSDFTEDPTLTTQPDSFVDALDFILSRADALEDKAGKPVKVVINFSYGMIAGPHDGTNFLESIIEDEISANPHLRVVIPAGNSHLSRCHTRLRLPAVPGRAEHSEPVDLFCRVQPDDRTDSFIQIWLPRHGVAAPTPPGRLEVALESPNANLSPFLGEFPNTEVNLLDADGRTIASLRYYFGSFGPAPTSRGVFEIEIAPTARIESVTEPIAPSGVWTIRLRNLGLNPETDYVHVWIQRDDTPYGFRRGGRQSYFDHECYSVYDDEGWLVEEDPPLTTCVIRRAGLMNALATGHNTIVAGGYRGEMRRAADYSAGGQDAVAGNAAPPPRGVRAPDVVQLSDDSKVHAGVLAAGSRSGSVVALNGTSVAAPQLARFVGERLANGHVGNRPDIQSQAMPLAPVARVPPRPLPDHNRHGAGHIDNIAGLPIVPFNRREP